MWKWIVSHQLILLGAREGEVKTTGTNAEDKERRSRGGGGGGLRSWCEHKKERGKEVEEEARGERRWRKMEEGEEE